MNWRISVEEVLRHSGQMISAYLGEFVSKIVDSLAWSFIPIFLLGLKMSAEDIGIVVGSFTTSWSLSMPFIGYLSDRFGRKKLTIVGLLIQALVLFFFDRVTGFTSGIALSLGMGLGTGLYYVVLPTTVGGCATCSC